ncbi:hypothetical protein [Pseudanabaena sp. PCC 6802]|uniref:hypothetical protein n=1 Tax=Pseudanabaena sp. PCC 6802 TaxID=118173 RepID=UPI00034A3ECB|nr:hypothetical protein [Pseudanabaena sp. PCC 6802]
MRSLQAFISLGIATLLLNACSNAEPPQIVTSTATPTSAVHKTSTATTSPASAPKLAARTPTTPIKTKIFLDKPVTTQNPVSNVSAVLRQAAPPPYGLIATTSKAKRQQELLARVNVQTNPDRDPFSTLPGTVAIPPPPPPPLKLPPLVPPQPLAVKPPRPYVLPQPVLKEAETVKVTGTVEIAGRRYAIVSVPGDVTSQYVREGQRIAGNKVLVKYIETGGTPMVILQQNGVEFARYIK